MMTKLCEEISIDGLVQDRSISIATALEILQSRTKPSIDMASLGNGMI